MEEKALIVIIGADYPPALRDIPLIKGAKRNKCVTLRSIWFFFFPPYQGGCRQRRQGDERRSLNSERNVSFKALCLHPGRRLHPRNAPAFPDGSNRWAFHDYPPVLTTPPTVMNFSMREKIPGPMPFTFMMSAGLAKGPFSTR